MDTEGMFAVMDKLIEIEARKKGRTERPGLIPNDDWTPIITELIESSLGATVNVIDDRLDREYTGTLLRNRLDEYSYMGLIVEGPGVSFSISDIMYINAEVAKGGLIIVIRVGNNM